MATKDIKLRLLIEAVNNASREFTKVTSDVKKLDAQASKTEKTLLNTPKSSQAGFTKLSGTIDKLRTKMEGLQKTASAIQSAGMQIGIAGAALLGASLFPVAQAGAFEKTMSEVVAVTASAAENYSALEAEAMRLGEATKFTAQQSAEGLVMLGRAGFTAQESITALEPSLILAAAGNITLGESADFATNILGGMGLAVEDLPRVVDVLANTAANSNSTIIELAEAMSYGASSAKAAGIPIEELASSFGVLHDAGVKSSRAGTAIRGMAAKIASQTPKASAAMKRLGVEVTTAADGSLDFTKLMEDLGDAWDNSGNKLQNLSDATDIFGRIAANGALILADNTEKMRDLTMANENAEGVAKKMADTMMNNLFGAVVELKSAFEGLLIVVGKPLLDVFEKLTDKVKSGVTWLNKFAKENEGLVSFLVITTAAMGALATVVGAVLIPLGFAVGAIANLAPALGAVAPLLIAAKIALSALLTAAMAHPVIAALALAIWGIAAAYKQANVDHQKLADGYGEVASEQKKEADSLRSLGIALRDNEEGSSAYIKAQQELAKVIPGVNVYVDGQGRVLADLGTSAKSAAEEVAGLTAVMDAKRERTLILQLEAQSLAMNDAESDVKSYKANLADWYNIQEKGVQKNDDLANVFWRTLNKFTGTYDKNIAKGVEYQANLDQTKSRWNSILVELQKGGATIDDVSNAMNEIHISDETRDNVLAVYAQMITAAEEAADKVSTAVKDRMLAEGTALEDIRTVEDFQLDARSNALAAFYANRINQIRVAVATGAMTETEGIKQTTAIQLEEYVAREKIAQDYYVYVSSLPKKEAEAVAEAADAAEKASSDLADAKIAFAEKATDQIISEIERSLAAEEKLAARIISISEKITSQRTSAEDKIRSIRQKGMTDQAKQIDLEAQGYEKLRQSQQVLSTGDTERAATLAKQAESILGGLTSEADAIKGIRTASDLVTKAYEAQRDAAQKALDLQKQVTESLTSSLDGVRTSIDNLVAGLRGENEISFKFIADDSGVSAEIDAFTQRARELKTEVESPMTMHLSAGEMTDFNTMKERVDAFNKAFTESKKANLDTADAQSKVSTLSEKAKELSQTFAKGVTLVVDDQDITTALQTTTKDLDKLVKGGQPWVVGIDADADGVNEVLLRTSDSLDQMIEKYKQTAIPLVIEFKGKASPEAELGTTIANVSAKMDAFVTNVEGKNPSLVIDMSRATSELERLASMLELLPPTVSVQVLSVVIGAEDVTSLLETLQYILDTYDTEVTARVTGAEDVSNLVRLIESLVDKTISVTANVLGLSAVASLGAAINALHDKTVTITTVTRNVSQHSAGGPIFDQFKRMAGRLSGYGGGDRRKVLLEDGEYIIPKDAVRYYGQSLFDKIRSMSLPLQSIATMQLGGLVMKSPQIPQRVVRMASGGPIEKAAATHTLGTVNFTLGNKSYGMQTTPAVARQLLKELKKAGMTVA